VAKTTWVRTLFCSWEGQTSREVTRGRRVEVMGFVDWRFFCSMRRCPLLVASDFGRCLVTNEAVRPGQESKLDGAEKR
jgi:hypothetical protein